MLIGTSLYNAYLRLCGARIGGNDNMFILNSIQIGNHCSISARSVLHSRVNIDNHVIVKPLTYICK